MNGPAPRALKDGVGFDRKQSVLTLDRRSHESPRLESVPPTPPRPELFIAAWCALPIGLEKVHSRAGKPCAFVRFGARHDSGDDTEPTIAARAAALRPLNPGARIRANPSTEFRRSHARHSGTVQLKAIG